MTAILKMTARGAPSFLRMILTASDAAQASADIAGLRQSITVPAAAAKYKS